MTLKVKKNMKNVVKIVEIRHIKPESWDKVTTIITYINTITINT